MRTKITNQPQTKKLIFLSEALLVIHKKEKKQRGEEFLELINTKGGLHSPHHVQEQNSIQNHTGLALPKVTKDVVLFLKAELHLDVGFFPLSCSCFPSPPPPTPKQVKLQY